RKLLVLDPTHQAPARDTPVFTVPFVRAQKWIEANGTFKAELDAPKKVSPNRTTVVAVRLQDPLALAVGARVHYRASSGEFQSVSQPITRIELAASTVDLDYFVEILDSSQNTLAELGTKEAPNHVRAVREPALWRPLLQASIGTIVISAALLAVAIGVDARYTSTFKDLEASGCAPGCDLSSLPPRGVMIGFYTTGALVGATSIALFIADA